MAVPTVKSLGSPVQRFVLSASALALALGAMFSAGVVASADDSRMLALNWHCC